MGAIKIFFVQIRESHLFCQLLSRLHEYGLYWHLYYFHFKSIRWFIYSDNWTMLRILRNQEDWGLFSTISTSPVKVAAPDQRLRRSRHELHGAPTGFGLDCSVSLRNKSLSTNSLSCQNRPAETFKLITLFVKYCCNELKKLVFAHRPTKQMKTKTKKVRRPPVH